MFYHRLVLPKTKILIFSIVTLILLSAALYHFWPSTDPNATKDSNKNQQLAYLSIQEDDHVYGDMQAPITLVEYSSVECISCKKLHTVFKKIAKSYPTDIAWVFRHAPQTIYPKSFVEAEALECASEQGGSHAFFNYLDSLFEATNSDNSLELSVLPEIANTVGLDVSRFDTCLKERRFTKRVNRDLYMSSKLDVTTRPHIFIITPDKNIISLVGYQSYTSMETLITHMLSQKR